jgi:undecaprenyl-diphosphatase
VNYQLFELLNRGAGRVDGLDDVMEFAAERLIYVVFAAGAALFALALYRGRSRAVLESGVALAIAFAAATGLTHLSREPRPFQSHQVHQLVAHGGGVSLPSDHATAAFAVAFAVGAFLHRRWGMVLAAAAVLIGLSRVWVGLHYPGDILAAAVIAGLAVLEVKLWTRWWARAQQSATMVLPRGR